VEASLWVPAVVGISGTAVAVWQILWHRQDLMPAIEQSLRVASLGTSVGSRAPVVRSLRLAAGPADASRRHARLGAVISAEF